MIFVITFKIKHDTVSGHLFDTNSEGDFLSIKIIRLTNKDYGTLTSLIALLSMATKLGPAYLSMTIVTLSTSGALSFSL